MDARRWSGRSRPGDDPTRPSPYRSQLDVRLLRPLAILGILLIVFAIPFGLMLAPLAIGIIVLVVAVRRLDRGFAHDDRSPVS